ncbi:MAG: hypothetical protein ABEH59_13840 [Halobacteriales archaeon]
MFELTYGPLGFFASFSEWSVVALKSVIERNGSPSIEDVVRIAVPVALAILTWLGLLLTVGFLARVNSLSLLNILPIFFLVLLFWPIYSVAPWRPGAGERVQNWIRGQYVEFAVLGGLWMLPIFPLGPDLLVTVIQLPYRGSGVFFGASLFYRERLNPTASRLLLNLAQVYIQALWLYFLSKGTVGLVRRVR